MSTTRVAVVTGANKGIGFEIVKRLCKEFDGIVYLTARDVANGQKAVAKLEAEGLHPRFHQLDITSQESVEKFKDYLDRTYGGLDVLVNNAGTAYKNASTAPFSEQASVTVANNFTGTLRVTKALFPLIRPHGRVVNVSSTGGRLGILQEHLRKKFTDPNLTEEGLVALMDQFVKDVHDGHHLERGWPNAAYGTSKVGMTALNKVYAREAARLGKEDVLVNACCPGWCQTDMSSQTGPNTAAQGAETPVLLALLPAGSPTGEFWRDKTIVEW